MISKRNFFTITLIMLLVMFLFQFSEFIKSFYNQYDENVYANQGSGLKRDSEFAVQTDAAKIISDSRRYIVYIGRSDDRLTGTALTQWCKLTGRNMLTIDSVLKYEQSYKPQMVMVDSSYIDFPTQTGRLYELAMTGTPIVFCNLPSPDIIRGDGQLRELLGISDIRDARAAVTGIRLYDGFLLGGERWYVANTEKEEQYQDLNLTVAWYNLNPGTKVYMAGVADKDKYGELKNEAYQPAIIWRYRTQNSCVFAVNGSYMSDNTALGIYSAFVYESQDYDIYPVVNSQSIIAINYPTFAPENDAEMKKRYSRTTTETLRDIIWPNLSAMTSRMGARMTYMVTPQHNYTDPFEPDEKTLIYYFKLFRESGDEAGWAAYNLQEGTSLRRKLLSDYNTFNTMIPNYKLLSIYVNNYSRVKTLNMLKTTLLRDVKTVVTDYEPHTSLFEYASGPVLELRTTNDGRNYRYSNDLKNRSIQTALAYSAVTLDMTEVLIPQEDSPEWTAVYEEFSTNLNEYWKNFQQFDKSTVSEADNRARKLLAMTYTQEKKADTILLNISNHEDEEYFILRIHNSVIDDISGATCVKLEDGAYLIKAHQEAVSIHVAPDVTLRYE